MRNLMLSLILYILAVTANGTPMSEEDRKAFIETATPGCLARQKEQLLSKSWAASQQNEYCDCYINRAANLITHEDLQQFTETNSNSHITPKLDESDYYCMRMLLKKWGKI